MVNTEQRRTPRAPLGTFDEFGWESLEDEAQRQRISLEAVVARAAEYFESNLDSGRMAVRVPPFAQKPGSAGGQELRLNLRARTWDSLRDEAARQQVPLERLLEHAALYYLADLHDGRIADRTRR